MSMAPFYCVVEFTTENSVAVISSKWLLEDDTRCYWPNGPVNVRKLVKKHAQPGPKWNTHSIRIKRTYDTFERASEGASKFEYVSDWATSGKESSTKDFQRSRKSKKKKQSGTGFSLGLVGSPRNISSGSSQSSLDKPSHSPIDVRNLSSFTSPNKSFQGSAVGLGKFVSNGAPETSVDTDYGLRRLNTPQASSSVSVPLTRSGLEETSLPTTSSGLIQQLIDRQERFENTVIDYLIKILNNQREILRRTTPLNTDVPVSSDIFELPVSGPEELEKLNSCLESVEKFNSMVNNLAIVGGEKLQEVVNRILSTFFENKFAVQISFTGKGLKAKSGLHKTKTLDLIYASVRKTRKGKDAENSQIDDLIRKWLKGASDREGGRAARRLAAECRKKELEKNAEAHPVVNSGETFEMRN